MRSLLVVIALAVVGGLLLVGLEHGPGEVPAPEPVPAPGLELDRQAEARRHYGLGAELATQGRWPEAIVHYQEGIRLGPYDEALRYALGSVMLAHADPEETIAYYRSTVSTDPKPQTSHYFWGMALAAQGDTERAIERFRVALEIDPAHELSRLAWGRARLGQRRPAEALVQFEIALEIDPDFVAAHLGAAEALRQLGRGADAGEREAMAESIVPRPERKPLYWGRYLLRQGRIEAAIRELERALEADPESTEVQEALAEARGRPVEALPATP